MIQKMMEWWRLSFASYVLPSDYLQLFNSTLHLNTLQLRCPIPHNTTKHLQFYAHHSAVVQLFISAFIYLNACYTFVCVALYQHITNFKLQIKCSKWILLLYFHEPLVACTISNFQLTRSTENRMIGMIFIKCSYNGLFIFILNCMNNFFLCKMMSLENQLKQFLNSQ